MDYSQSVRAFVVENFLFGDSSSLQDDTSFMQEGIIDSTGILELILFVEKTHDIKILAEEMIPSNLDSVNKVARFIEKKRQASPS